MTKTSERTDLMIAKLMEAYDEAAKYPSGTKEREAAEKKVRELTKEALASGVVAEVPPKLA